MSESGPKGALPYGWQVKISKNYPNRVYYFNVLTGSTTWECPELDPPRSLKEKQEEASGNIVVKTPKTPEEDENFNLKKSRLLEKHSVHKVHRLEKSVSHLHDISKYCPSISKDDASKPYVPPTAVVSPVVLKFDKKVHFQKAKNSIQVSTAAKKTAEVGEMKVSRPIKLKRTFNKIDDTPDLPKGCINAKKLKRKKTQVDKPDLDIKKDTQKSLENTASVSQLNDGGKVAEDVEMIDVSMDYMDDLTTKNDTIFDVHAKYYIVVDTNVLISELSLIDELKETPLDGCGPPHIFIPWVVIEELDKLKKKSSSKIAMRAAGEAIRYLNSVLGKHPRFHGQSPAEAEKWAKTYSKVNDDKILECCIALGDKMSKEKVILLTNDKNLVNKALICKINVHNWVSMMEKIKPDIVFNINKHNGKRRNSAEKELLKNGAVDTSKAAASNSQDKFEGKVLQRQRDICKRDIHTLMSSARQVLKDVLGEYFKEKMDKAYGNIWLNFPIDIKLLKGILEALLRYWKMVFSEFLSEKDRRNIALLYEKARRPEGFLGDKEECLIILSTIEDIFREIQKKCPKTKIPVEKVQDYRVQCVNIFLQYNDVESSIQEGEFKDVHAVFEQTWGVINQLCGLVMDFANVPHDFKYEKPEAVPSEFEFRRLFCNLYPGVQQLKTTMANMLNTVRNNKPTRTTSKKLANALLQCIPSLEIQCELVPHPYFTIRALERFFMYPQNREMVEIGYKQIEKFYSKLDEALSAVMKVQFRKGSTTSETMLFD